MLIQGTLQVPFQGETPPEVRKHATYGHCNDSSLRPLPEDEVQSGIRVRV